MTTSERASDDAAGDRRAASRPGSESSDRTAPWHRRRWTTIVLEEYGGGWRATQTGVAAEGHGDTAAAAAAAYCLRIAETGDRRRRDGGADAAEGTDATGEAVDRSVNGRGGRDG